MRKRQLVSGKRISTARAHHPLGVNQSNALQGLFTRQAFFSHGIGNQMRNTGGSRSRPQEKHALLRELFALNAHGRVQPRNRHRGRALNVIIKAWDLVLPTLEQFESVRILEILKLDHHIWPTFTRGFNEFLDQSVIVVAVNALLLQTEVQRITQVAFVVGANVKRHGKNMLRIDAGAGSVKRELADRNTHAVDAQVTQAQNALAVGHHDHLHIVRGHIFDQFAHATAVVDRHIQTARIAENVAELLARFTDSGRVNERHVLFDVLDHQTEEGNLVGRMNAVQNQIFAQSRRLRGDHLFQTADLFLNARDARRQKAAQTIAVPFFFSKGRTLIKPRVAQQIYAAHFAITAVVHFSQARVFRCNSEGHFRAGTKTLRLGVPSCITAGKSICQKVRKAKLFSPLCRLPLRLYLSCSAKNPL